MRVDATNKVNQVYQANNVKKVTMTSSINTSDSLVLSQTGKDIQIAKQAIAQIPDVREDKVNQLKASLASGTYDVSAEELADKLIDNYFDQSI